MRAFKLSRRSALLGGIVASIGGPAPLSRAVGHPIFLTLERINVSVARGTEIARHEMLLMMLEMADLAALAQARAAMPRLRDAFIRVWNRIGARPDAYKTGLDIEGGRRAMMAVCAEILGPERVVAVVVTGRSGRDIDPGGRRRGPTTGA
jgi:hypothetical protein